VKKSLRLESKKILSLISDNEFQSKGEDLSVNLNGLLKDLASFERLQPDYILGGFSPIQKEPLWFCKLDKVEKLALPKIEDEKMVFFLVNDYSLLDKKIISLKSENVIAQVEPNVLIIPGLMFSESGERLGRGGGYYDRYLENHDVIKIGVCFDEQVNSNIKTEEHDINIDYLITDKKIYKIKE
jgi:5-formyltetrahydrofolate cyclo-ligase